MEPVIIATRGRPDLAQVHLLRFGDDPRRTVETVDAIDPRYPRSEKAVVILSTQLGCPVGCVMCDAAASYHGDLSAEEILGQLRFVMAQRPDLAATRKLKVHFARMGEPALNAAAVLEALEKLRQLLPTPALIPCISTMAPRGSRPFFAELLRLKERLFPPGHFQLQLSLNSTDAATRRRLIPSLQLDPEEMAAAAGPFHRPGDRRVVLNFALARGVPVDPQALRATFDPACFMVKLTPVNPTGRAQERGLETVLSAEQPEAAAALVEDLVAAGFETVVSIGEPDEIEIGSNCGQLVRELRGGADERSRGRPLASVAG